MRFAVSSANRCPAAASSTLLSTLARPQSGSVCSAVCARYTSVSMLLSVVIPALNEEGSILDTLTELTQSLAEASVPHEVVVVDDGSTDGTSSLIGQYAEVHPAVRLVRNEGRHGFGMAVRCGLEAATGDVLAVMMADKSDDPQDLVSYYRAIADEGYDCVFGSRFMKGARVLDYPPHKLLINRIANWFIRPPCQTRLHDTT